MGLIKSNSINIAVGGWRYQPKYTGFNKTLRIRRFRYEPWPQVRHKLHEAKILIIDKTRFDHMCLL